MANKKTDKPDYVAYVDQYGNVVFARTVKELCQKCYRSKASRMYRDTKDGRTLHVGYIVGDRWFTAYVPHEQEA